MLTTSPEESPSYYGMGTQNGHHIMPDYFTYAVPFTHVPLIVPLEPVCYIEHKDTHQEIAPPEEEPPMEEDIDVETVEEAFSAAELLKKEIHKSDSYVPSTSHSTTNSYTNLEPFQPISDEEFRPKTPKIQRLPNSSQMPKSNKRPELRLEQNQSSDDDCDLSRYTPRSTLRQIEEHGQYDATHDKDRKFKCQYCHKRFVRKEEKLRHERSHTNDRKYKCRICNLRFLRADHRKGHEETHSDIKKFKCEPCNKSFRRKDEYNRHCQRKICKANKVKNEK